MIKVKIRNSGTIHRAASAQCQPECRDVHKRPESIHRIVLIKNGIFVGSPARKPSQVRKKPERMLRLPSESPISM
jgi:hypothetical protein